MYCDCEICREATRRGGKDLRMRTSYNFGGSIQIDAGPDFLQAWHRHPDAMRKISHILITHSHSDHFLANEFFYHGPGFSPVPLPAGTLTVHGTAPTFAKLAQFAVATWNGDLAGNMERAGVAFHRFAQFDDFTLDDCGARVRTFAADHDGKLDPCVLIVTLGGRTVFICHDTGWLPKKTWDALAAINGEVSIDVAVLDNTGMLRGAPESPVQGDAWRGSHMSAPTVLETFDKLDALHLLAPGCMRAVNHFSHNGGCLHDELCAFYEPRGIIVGHDDLEL